MDKSIIEKYYSEAEFIDRYLKDREKAVDVIIPVLNTNELWKSNLYSFYREIPINRLLIGDGGVSDNTLDVLEDFPRVEVLKFKNTTLGFRIARLIENVQTEFFIYLHSDVYLPEGWFYEMYKYRNKYDWFECYRKLTCLIEIWSDNQNHGERALSGSQFGKTSSFKEITPKIEDDYSYRQEDIIFAELILENGGSYGRVKDTYHYHQIMNKPGADVPEYKLVSVERNPDEKFEKMVWDTQVRGIIKYLKPKNYLIKMVNGCLYGLDHLSALDWSEFKKWVKKTNPIWLKHIKKKGSWKQRLAMFARETYKKWK